MSLMPAQRPYQFFKIVDDLIMLFALAKGLRPSASVERAK
jgi:hypothetical protein